MKMILALVATLLFSSQLLAAGQTSALDEQAPGYYRMKLGKLRVTAVSDGTVTVPLNKLLTNISPEKLRQAMAGELHEIHENRLSARGYGKLAQKVEAEVGNIVANCKLGAQADEQLHIVIVELLGGTEHMAGKFKGGKRQNGAVQVIGALEKYAAYFDDPGFKPIEH